MPRIEETIIAKGLKAVQSRKLTAGDILRALVLRKPKVIVGLMTLCPFCACPPVDGIAHAPGLHTKTCPYAAAEAFVEQNYHPDGTRKHKDDALRIRDEHQRMREAQDRLNRESVAAREAFSKVLTDRQRTA